MKPTTDAAATAQREAMTTTDNYRTELITKNAFTMAEFTRLPVIIAPDVDEERKCVHIKIDYKRGNGKMGQIILLLSTLNTKNLGKTIAALEASSKNNEDIIAKVESTQMKRLAEAEPTLAESWEDDEGHLFLRKVKLHLGERTVCLRCYKVFEDCFEGQPCESQKEGKWTAIGIEAILTSLKEGDDREITRIPAEAAEIIEQLRDVSPRMDKLAASVEALLLDTSQETNPSSRVDEDFYNAGVKDALNLIRGSIRQVR